MVVQEAYGVFLVPALILLQEPLLVLVVPMEVGSHGLIDLKYLLTNLQDLL